MKELSLYEYISVRTRKFLATYTEIMFKLISFYFNTCM